MVRPPPPRREGKAHHVAGPHPDLGGLQAHLGDRVGEHRHPEAPAGAARRGGDGRLPRRAGREATLPSHRHHGAAVAAPQHLVVAPVVVGGIGRGGERQRLPHIQPGGQRRDAQPGRRLRQDRHPSDGRGGPAATRRPHQRRHRDGADRAGRDEAVAVHRAFEHPARGEPGGGRAGEDLPGGVVGHHLEPEGIADQHRGLGGLDRRPRDRGCRRPRRGGGGRGSGLLRQQHEQERGKHVWVLEEGSVASN